MVNRYDTDGEQAQPLPNLFSGGDEFRKGCEIEGRRRDVRSGFRSELHLQGLARLVGGCREGRRGFG